jgi:hypothetical protein
MASLWVVTSLGTSNEHRNDSSSVDSAALEKLKTHIVVTKVADGTTSVGSGQEEVEKVPTGTSSVPHFPRYLDLADSSPSPSSSDLATPKTRYQLIGLGIRTVSFLSVQVYVVGLYIALDDIRSLQSALLSQIDPIATTATEPERERLKAWLLSGEDSERVWNDVLKFTKMRTVFRVVPTRNTDFGHMRDGWVRGIGNKSKFSPATIKGKATAADATAKEKEFVLEQAIERFEDEEFGQAMNAFKSLLGGKGSLKKGKEILLVRDLDGRLELRVEDQAQNTTTPAGDSIATASSKSLGHVHDERVSRLLWLNYLAGATVASEHARKNIVDGIMGFVERPIGTVEVKVE